MKILVFGAGVLGSLYAARLHQSGEQVTILARGERSEQIRKNGIILQEAQSGHVETVKVDQTDRLQPDDYYDLVLILVRASQISTVLPVITHNKKVNQFLFMVNNAAGYGTWLQATGQDRLLCGFAGAGGTLTDGVIGYSIVPGFIQKTTIGGPEQFNTDLARRIIAVIKKAEFPSTFCSDMDAWQKTHVALISPLANAIYMAGGNQQILAIDARIIPLTISAIKEGFTVIRRLGLEVTPARLDFNMRLPGKLLAGIFRKWSATVQFRNVAMEHALTAIDEMGLLADQFRQLADQAGMPTPAIDELRSHIPVD